jgi:hypothetical protein
VLLFGGIKPASSTCQPQGPSPSLLFEFQQ